MKTEALLLFFAFLIVTQTAGVPTDTKKPAAAPASDDQIFRGCGETKSCFGIPENCYRFGDCQLFTAVTFDEGREIFAFELLSSGEVNYQKVVTNKWS
jgi:hypothetical protein